MATEKIETALGFSVPERRGAAGSETRVRADIKVSKIDGLTSSLNAFAVQQIGRIEQRAADLGAARGGEAAAEAVSRVTAENQKTAKGIAEGTIDLDAASFTDPASEITELLKSENRLIRRAGQFAYNEALRNKFESESVRAFLNQMTLIRARNPNNPDQAAADTDAALVGHLSALSKADSTGKLTAAVSKKLAVKIAVAKEAALTDRVEAELKLAQEQRDVDYREVVSLDMQQMLDSKVTPDAFLEILTSMMEKAEDNSNLSAQENEGFAQRISRVRSQYLMAYYTGIFQEEILKKLDFRSVGSKSWLKALRDGYEFAGQIEEHKRPLKRDDLAPFAKGVGGELFTFETQEIGIKVGRFLESLLAPHAAKKSGAKSNLTLNRKIIIAGLKGRVSTLKMAHLNNMTTPRDQLTPETLDSSLDAHLRDEVQIADDDVEVRDAELFSETAQLWRESDSRINQSLSRTELERELQFPRDLAAAEGMHPDVVDDWLGNIEEIEGWLKSAEADGEQSDLFFKINPARGDVSLMWDTALKTKNPRAKFEDLLKQAIFDGLGFAEKVFGGPLDKNFVAKSIVDSMGAFLRGKHRTNPDEHRAMVMSIHTALKGIDPLAAPGIIKDFSTQLEPNDATGLAMQAVDLAHDAGAGVLAKDILFNGIMQASKVDVESMKNAYLRNPETDKDPGDMDKIFTIGAKGGVELTSDSRSRVAGLVGAGPFDTVESQRIINDTVQRIYTGYLEKEINIRRKRRVRDAQQGADIKGLTDDDYDDAAESAVDKTSEWLESLPPLVEVFSPAIGARGVEVQSIKLFLPQSVATPEVLQGMGIAFMPQNIEGAVILDRPNRGPLTIEEALVIRNRASYEFDGDQVFMMIRGLPVRGRDGKAIQYTLPSEVIENMRLLNGTTREQIQREFLEEPRGERSSKLLREGQIVPVKKDTRPAIERLAEIKAKRLKEKRAQRLKDAKKKK